MGADGTRRPNLPALAQVELKGAQKGLEFLPLPREGELETRQQQHTGQKVGPEDGEQGSMKGPQRCLLLATMCHHSWSTAHIHRILMVSSELCNQLGEEILLFPYRR